MKQLRCALYPRVSTEEQFIHGLSMAAQIQDLTDYANRMGYKIVGIYPDEGVSARKPISKRPALLRLLKDVEEGKIDIILVTKLDRWFRNIKEYQITEEILRRNHCYWKTVFEDYDTSTANGQMVVNIMLAVNQNECDRTSERIKTVFAHKIRNGEHLTGAAPYGYVTVNKKLEKDPATREIVDDVINYYFSCFSKRKTVFYILGKYDSHPKKPSQYQINRILSLDLYAGIYQGREGYYPAYLTREQLSKIRSVSDTKTYSHTLEPYIFSGLIMCPTCSVAMTGFVKKQKLKNGDVSQYKRYRCYKKFVKDHNGACISETVVEKYMLSHVCTELSRIVCITQNACQSAEDKTPALRAELDRLNSMFQKGRITEEFYDAQYDMISAALEKEKEKHAENDLEKYQKIQEEFSGDWTSLYQRLDAAHKNAFWKRVVKSIHVDPDTHKISGFSFL